MVGPGVIPEQGITAYASDKTQGPVCAMACPAGTLFRNYFAMHGGVRFLPFLFFSFPFSLFPFPFSLFSFSLSLSLSFFSEYISLSCTMLTMASI